MTRRLHIGGEEHKDGWELLSVQPGPYVDYLGDASQLLFQNNTFDVIYASHILEHVKAEPVAVLKEWARVLKPSGELQVSVPDMNYLCQLFLTTTNLQDRIKVMQIIYGGQVDEFDYHVIGYDEDMIRNVLVSAGFKHIHRTISFGLFDDCSDLKINGKPVSINLTAQKELKDRVIPLETAL